MRNRSLSFSIKIFLYLLSLLVIFTFLVIIIQYQREKRHKVEELNSKLSIYNTIVYNKLHSSSIESYPINALISSFPDQKVRISVFDTQGNVLFDSEVGDVSTLENHSQRKEFLEAKKHGQGTDIRISESTHEKYYYLIHQFNDMYIRAALPYDINVISSLRIEKSVFYMILLLFLLIVIGAVFISRIFHRTFLQLRNIVSHSNPYQPSVQKDLFNIVELNEISNHLSETYHKLQKVKDELLTEKEKLFQHLSISKEGLAIFSPEKKCIVSNELFMTYSNMITAENIDNPERIFQSKEFYEITLFLEKNSNDTIHHISRESFEIKINNHIYFIQCILFHDKSFEISINDITTSTEQNKIKRELTQNIAHELKTPVASIALYLETVLNSPNITEDQKDVFLKKCYAQTERLSRLVNEISLLNRIDSKSNFFEKEKILLNKIIENVLNDLQYAAKDKSITFHADLIPNMIIQGNKSLLYSIFGNLVDNSIQYAGENISITLKSYREDESYYYFTYYDTGIGISEEHLPRIFERFYRIDKGRSREIGGTGLGLAIAKNAVIFHGGSISAKNRDGGGLEFFFTLKKLTSNIK